MKMPTHALPKDIVDLVTGGAIAKIVGVRKRVRGETRFIETTVGDQITIGAQIIIGGPITTSGDQITETLEIRGIPGILTIVIWTWSIPELASNLNSTLNLSGNCCPVYQGAHLELHSLS